MTKYLFCALVGAMVVVAFAIQDVGASADITFAGTYVTPTPRGVRSVTSSSSSTGVTTPITQTISIPEVATEEAPWGVTASITGDKIESYINPEGDDQYGVKITAKSQPHHDIVPINMQVAFEVSPNTTYHVQYKLELADAPITWDGRLEALPKAAPGKMGSNASSQIDFWVRGWATGSQGLPTTRTKLMDGGWQQAESNTAKTISKSGDHTGDWVSGVMPVVIGDVGGSHVHGAVMAFECEILQDVDTDSGNGSTKTLSRTTEYTLKGWKYSVTVVEAP